MIRETDPTHQGRLCLAKRIDGGDITAKMESVEGCLDRPFVSKIDSWASFGETGSPALLEKGSRSSIRGSAVSRPSHNLAFLHLGLSASSLQGFGKMLGAEPTLSWPRRGGDERSIMLPL